MPAVIYIRVSTEDQARHGYSLAGQEEACVQRAKELGAAEMQIYKDEGITGSVLERPGLQQALAAVKAGGAEYFIVYDPDRLSRKLSHQLLLSEEIEKAGCRLEFVNFDWQDTPEGRLFYSMRGAIAEYEKEKFLMRSKFGKKAKAKKGLLTHSPGIFGYNYVSEKSTLEINEEQAQLYRQMVDIIFSGGSPEKIAAQFNAVGIPGPRGGRWYRATVRRILKNPTYTGTMFLNRLNTEGVKAKRAVGKKVNARQRPQKEWIAVSVPALISAAEWQALQRELAAGKHSRRGKRVNFYLLSKVLYCGVCGSSMYGRAAPMRNKRGFYRYYVCARRAGCRDRKNPQQKCTGRYFKAEMLEELVWSKLKEWLFHPDAPLHDTAGGGQRRNREKENLQRQTAALAKEKERVFAAYRRGILDIDDFAEAVKDIDGKLAAAENRLNEIVKDEQAQHLLPQKADDFQALAQEMREKIDELPQQDKKHLVELLISRIEVSDAEVVITAKVPPNA